MFSLANNDNKNVNRRKRLRVIMHYFLLFRYLVNDACVLAGKPLVSGSALRFEGQVLLNSSRFS